MGQSMPGTICQLVCDADTQVNFARLVGDLDTVLGRFAVCPVTLTWDCEDIALFDMPGTRILLGWNERIGLDDIACLTVSVGPSPMAATGGQFPAHDAMCVQLVERVQRRIPHQAVLWHNVPGIATAETVDELVDGLPRLFSPNVSKMMDEVAEIEAEDEIFDAVEPPAAMAQPMPKWHDPELGRLRHALYPPAEEMEEPAAPSAQMRLAVHAMNATLLAVNAPIGAAVMTYGLFRGGDMRFSSRAMTLAGLSALMFNSPVGASLVAMAGA